ncbi:hypothetical protein BKA64DRAFT_380163 [Cadophora sp. MPI-SDFR-AT-0126]|nr:hypothetical protein BKA64DRAFT_380163 [Leotiomycetes sp. MPI-SDFR-AT-0126]
MDQLWHAAILDTQLYAGLQDALGLVIHHRPEGASDKEAEQRARRLSVMEGIYKTFFSTKPLESRPYTPPASPPQPPAVQSDMHDANEIRICVRTPAAHAIYFKVQPHAKFSSIITAVTDRMKISRKTIRLFHEGHRIKEYVDTIASRGVRDGDVLEVFLEQGGC